MFCKVISQKGVDKMEENLFKKILVETDGSENAIKAASYGVNIAKATEADVYALVCCFYRTCGNYTNGYGLERGI